MYIEASFMSDYHIDLSTVNMHWWKYCTLIGGLTENSILSKVRDIRNFDLSELKDEKQRAKMIKAKEAVALNDKRTKEEEELLDEFENLLL